MLSLVDHEFVSPSFSDYPFIETNPFLSFPRLASLGRRLDVAAGTAVRFEPGDSKTVSLVAIGGAQSYFGGNNLASGPITSYSSAEAQAALKRKIVEAGFANEDVEPTAAQPMTLSREGYASLYGPTTGDRIKLADTNLWIEVEKDLTSYGDECKFGGGELSFEPASSEVSFLIYFLIFLA